ncbi:MAG: membrane protein insertion efficiency factor YidD [Candidatus Acidiferrales bacterium]
MNLRGISRWLALASVRVYQIFLGPFFGGGCKFQPSCSAYAYEAIERFGARQGARLAIGRLMRCRPFSKGGYDPVPEESSEREHAKQGPRSVTAPNDGRAVEVLR